MRRALALARLAYDEGEVPVGCVIVAGDSIVSEAYNRREGGRNALLHAETAAIDAACKALGGWRLFMCDIYVTLEPCPMCAGAIINSRVKRVIYGAPDKRAGAFGSILDLNSYPFNHKPEVVGGVLEEESADLLKSFFRSLRKSTEAGDET